MAAQEIPAGLGQFQRERLACIDFRIYFLGEVSRADISARCGVASTGATCNLAIYHESALDNIYFEGNTKTYGVAPGFRPLFDYSIEPALSVFFHESGGRHLAINGAESAALAPFNAPLGETR